MRFLDGSSRDHRCKTGEPFFKLVPLFFEVVDLHLIELLKLAQPGKLIFRSFLCSESLTFFLMISCSASFTSASKLFLPPW